MDINFILAVDEAKRLYHERLREADQARLYQALREGRPSLGQRLVRKAGRRLILLGQKLKWQVRSKSPASV
jgi:hypothetical protein